MRTYPRVMTDNDIWGAIGSLVQERMDDVFEESPEEAIEWLAESLGSLERARALLGGEGIQLNARETRDICQLLHLDADIVSAVTSVASNEVLLHAIGLTLAGCPVLEADPCPVCFSLHERHERARSTDERPALESLALDVLAHIHALEDDDQLPAEASPLEMELYGLLSSLPQSSRLRVLASAYEEQERLESTGDDIQGLISRLVGDYLSPGARTLVDHIALQPEGEAKVADVAAHLGLTGAQLIALERDLLGAFQRFAAEHAGSAAIVWPVTKILDPEGARYQVAPELLAPLRALRTGTADA